MSKSASKWQEKVMSIKFRGKEIFKPLNTGIIDERVKCVREFVANIFFYTKNGTTIMIDAGYNYERLGEKMEWLLRGRGINPIVITGHTGWSDDLDFVFPHTDTVCRASKKQKPHDPNAPMMPMTRAMTRKNRRRAFGLKRCFRCRCRRRNT